MTKKTIFLIIGGFLLTSSLIAGLYLVKQQQETRREAYDPDLCHCGGWHEGWCDEYACDDNPACCVNGENPPPCQEGLVQCFTYGRCQRTDEYCPDGDNPAPPEATTECKIEDHSFKVKCSGTDKVSGTWAGCSHDENYATLEECNANKTGVPCMPREFTVDCDGDWHTVGSWSPQECTFYQEDLSVTGGCGKADIQCWSGDWSICAPPPTSTPVPTLTPTLTPTLIPTDTPRPTLPPDYTCACLNLEMYDQDWQLISDYSQLHPGDRVYLLVTGETDHPEGLTKARFRVDGEGWQESEQRYQGNFYWEFEIPDYGTYSVEAQVYNPSLGWY